MPHVTCPKNGCGWTVDPATVPAGWVITCPQCGQRFRLATAARTPVRRGEGFSSLLAVGGVVLVMAAVGGAIATAVLIKRKPSSAQSGPVRQMQDLDRNFAFTPPGGDWHVDKELSTSLGVNVAALHWATAPEAWAAVAVKDYGNRVPLGSELRDTMSATLGRRSRPWSRPPGPANRRACGGSGANTAPPGPSVPARRWP